MTLRIGYKDMVFPLTQKQETVVKFYSSGSEDHKIQKYCDYFMNVEEARRELAWNCVRTGGIVGGIFGLISGIFVLCFDDGEDENKSVKAAKIATGGLAGGAFLGSLYGGYQTVSQTWKSIPYFEWKLKAIRSNIFPLFRKFVDSSEMKDFLCPILHDFILVPVKDPFGRVYEKSAIEHWIDQKNASPGAGVTASPFRDMELKKTDLTFDMDYHVKVAVAIKKLFDQQIEQQYKEGLLEYRITIMKSRKELTGAIVEDITKKYVAGEISRAEFLEIAEACQKHYSLLHKPCQ